MESETTQSDSVKHEAIQIAIQQSSSKVNETNTAGLVSTVDTTNEGKGSDGAVGSPGKVIARCSNESALCDILPPTQSNVTNVESTTEGKAVGPTTTDEGELVEPPTKRQKTSEASPESGEPVVSSLDIATTAEVKATPPTESSNTSSKPVVTINNNHGPSITSTTQLLLPDYAALRQTVQDLLSLLQLYGPLTANQLEYNLPPVVPISMPWSVHDVLSILVAIGLVQHVKGTTDQFCIFGGIPRATAIYPTEIPSEIQRAINEAEDSYKRCQILREALCQTNTTTNDNHNGSNVPTKNYVDVLKQLLQEYPNVTNDPVYWTALRNCHIDMGSGTSSLPLSERRSSTTSKSNKGSSSTNTKEGSRSNKASKGTSAESLGNKIITEKKVVIPVSTSVSKVALISSPATASEKQLNATSKDGPPPSSSTITPAAANNVSALSIASETVEKTVETKFTKPTTQDEVVAVTISTTDTDVVPPKIIAKASTDDAGAATKSA